MESNKYTRATHTNPSPAPPPSSPHSPLHLRILTIVSGVKNEVSQQLIWLVFALSLSVFADWNFPHTIYLTNETYFQTTHVVGEESGDTFTYSCRWVGCKVFGKKSSKMSWLERHVPRHGSKFTHDCIVEGCRMRFSSQVSTLTLSGLRDQSIFGRIHSNIFDELVFRAW